MMSPSLKGASNMMEFRLPKPVSAYRCPLCGGKVVKALVEDDPGCVHLVQWTCRATNCHKTLRPTVGGAAVGR